MSYGCVVIESLEGRDCFPCPVNWMRKRVHLVEEQ
jgi:hypothetical protein